MNLTKKEIDILNAYCFELTQPIAGITITHSRLQSRGLLSMRPSTSGKDRVRLHTTEAGMQELRALEAGR